MPARAGRSVTRELLSSAATSTSAPPVRVASSESAWAVTIARPLSIVAEPEVNDPVASASSVIASSCQSGRPAASSSKPETLAATFAVERPPEPRSISTRPRQVPASDVPPMSSTSPSSPTSPPRSAVHCICTAAGVPAAETSIAGEVSRPSSIRSDAPPTGPRRARSQPVKGSFHRSGRSVAGSPTSPGGSVRTAARSRASSRTSRTRSAPSPRATAASRRLPPVTRTSGRTTRPPGKACAAAARSTSAVSEQSRPTQPSSHRQASSPGQASRPDTSPRATGDVNRSSCTTMSSSVNVACSGSSHRSTANSSASVSARQTANRSTTKRPRTSLRPAPRERSSRTSARPSKSRSAPILVATMLEPPRGSRWAVTVIVVSSPAGAETDQPPSRASTAAAAAGSAVRSSRSDSVGGLGLAGGSAGTGSAATPAYVSRPPAVQPANVPSGRSVPAAKSSTIRQASLRSVSTNSTVPPTTSRSQVMPLQSRGAASQGVRMSSSELPPRRTATAASTPASRIVPRDVGSSTSPSRPFSITSDRTSTAGWPA